MTDIGSALIGMFQPLGLLGGSLGLLILLYINAVAFPTLPEVFIVIIFSTGYGVDPFVLAAIILAVALISETVGLLSQYLLVKRFGVPRSIEKMFKRYQNFLLVRDERMILINRAAPLLPFLGGFVALAGWDLRLSLMYQALGGLIKYGTILLLGGLFLSYTQQGVAMWATLIVVVVMLALSFLASFQRQRRISSQENRHLT